MLDLRESLAVALGVGIGLLLLVAPGAAIKLSVAGGTQPHRGEYGSDGTPPERWLWIARGLGVVCLLVAAAIGLPAVL